MSGQLNDKALRRNKRQAQSHKSYAKLLADKAIAKRDALDNLLGVEIAREQVRRNAE